MIWSLFASVPLIARVKSPLYFESEWCRREHEMFKIWSRMEILSKADPSLMSEWIS